MPDILGTGLDLVDIPRIASLRARHKDAASLLTVFRQEELDYCLPRKNPDECLAARFAAKEAVMKAMGTGWSEGVSFTGIEVTKEATGKPGIRLHGKTLEKANELGVGKIHLSLSHSQTMAAAQVVIEKAESSCVS